MIFRLDDRLLFPDPQLAEEDGLLAIGGDLSVERLRLAYQNGIFPWYSEETPILWYSPHERFVLFPAEMKISKSMRQILRSGKFRITHDVRFDEVIEACSSAKRKGQKGTWIIEEMQEAYIRLHRGGYAHSIEVWENDRLAGGLYGLEVGHIFCGESMFSRISNASKAALISLCQSGKYELVDCQVYTEHLESMGARMISREEYMHILQNAAGKG
jgi:leucyl/phenylalanyl-tRNA--protein transferase